MKTFSTLVLALAALLLLPPRAGAQTAARLAETGPNDFRISHVERDGALATGARTPASAYNFTDQEYLVVWAAPDAGALAIFGQRLDATTGEATGPAFRVSPGGDDAAAAALTPAAVYNPAAHEYLVVWTAAADGAAEILGQRLGAATGEALGAPLQIAEAPATQPAVAYDRRHGHYLTVWRGVEADAPGAAEIFGQRLDAAGVPAGDVLRLSTTGPDGDPAFDAHHPAVAADPARGAFFVVWEGDPVVDGAFEVFGRRLDAATGEALDDALRLSAMGRDDDDPAFGAHRPAVAFNETADAYLVVWLGSDDAAGLAAGEFEVFGQRLDAATGKPLGADDFRISTMGDDKDARFAAAAPTVAFSPDAGVFLVLWRGDDSAAPLVEGEHELFARALPGDHRTRLDDAPAVRLSDMGPDGHTGYAALHPAVVHGPDGTFLTLWSGSDDALGGDAHAIFGQLVSAASEEGVDAFVEVPGELLFASPYPNPFNRSTTVTLAVREAQRVQVLVFDMLGRRVATLYEGTMEAGRAHPLVFDAAAHPSGPYFIQAVGETFLETKRIVLVR
ncbi:MAG: T9SS type A sorting domain-containing protein [Rhodothermales bacterium]|nr:T9SS type A sorting domain-containing protein [Rhodothermales bacterium]